MARGLTAKTIDKAKALIAYAEQHLDGFTREEVEEAFGWRHKEFVRTLHIARKLLEQQGQNLLCQPNGWGNPWLYRLEGEYLPYEDYLAWGLRYKKTRLQTELSMCKSLIKAMPVGSLEEDMAQMMALSVERALEDHMNLLRRMANQARRAKQEEQARQAQQASGAATGAATSDPTTATT